MRLTVIMMLDATDAGEIADEGQYQWLSVTDADLIEQLDCVFLGAVTVRA